MARPRRRGARLPVARRPRARRPERPRRRRGVLRRPAPAGPAVFLARRNVPDRKAAWLPVVWGPSYATGAAVFGRVGVLDYGAEVKNAALSARPSVWDATRRGLEEPTASGRIGVHPTTA